ncbi:MAG: hypothetical protein ACAI34_18035 [Verrucomicrobium sp.]
MTPGSRRTFLALSGSTMVGLAACHGSSAAPHYTAKTTLGISGTHFAINGLPVFLLGCSYYAALGATDATWKSDLDELQRLGFNWIRIWATWASFENDISAVHPKTGLAREPYLGRLKELLTDCDRRGMIVDVTLSRGNSVTGPAKLQQPEAHLEAVKVLVTQLRPWKNWFLDLSNERNLTDKRHTSYAALRSLAEMAHQIDPQRLLTASFAGDFGAEDLKAYVTEVKVDFLSPHRPRGAESPGQTEGRSLEWLQATQALGKALPILHQEPFRRGYGFSPALQDYVTDLRGAVKSGSAGWCFHQGDARKAPDGRPRRSFDLRDATLFAQLDQVERDVIVGLAAIVQEGAAK